MKRILTALSLLALATAAYAGVEVTTNPCLHRPLSAPAGIADALYRIDL